MSRADRVAGRLEDVDALLVTESANLRYVTGFTGSNGFALVGRDVRRFVTDFRYVEQAKVEVPDFEREQGPQELFAALKGFSGRLGFDDAHLSAIFEREEWRRVSVVRDLCVASVAGQGIDGYREALAMLKAELS